MRVQGNECQEQMDEDSKSPNDPMDSIHLASHNYLTCFIKRERVPLCTSHPRSAFILCSPTVSCVSTMKWKKNKDREVGTEVSKVVRSQTSTRLKFIKTFWKEVSSEVTIILLWGKMDCIFAVIFFKWLVVIFRGCLPHKDISKCGCNFMIKNNNKNPI